MDAIIVKDLRKSFLLGHEKYGTLKGLLLSFRRTRYERMEALKGISFTVQPGETLAIIGRNGSGKSTLLSILARVYIPTSGEYHLNGHLSCLLHLGAGFHPDLTGIENIYLNGAILGMTTKEIQSKYDAIVEFSELGKFIDAPIRTYSAGMVMRLGFSIAIQANPDILLVDEVLAVGDENFQQKCYDKVREFQQMGKTIVFVSHDIKAVKEVATRIIWLADGEIKLDGPVDEVLDEYIQFSHEAGIHA
jgi:ABC-2 type transport system ATP-binding protein/lipopolysaccharide transport system ATP-binding protein